MHLFKKKPSFIFILFLLYLVSAVAQDSPPASQHVYHRPEAFINSLKDDPKAGQKIYHEFCASCHAQDPIIQLGAPRFRVAGDWQRRAEKGMEAMLNNTSNGLNTMPPRGGCFECSDEQLKAAIIYMLPKKFKLSFFPLYVSFPPLPLCHSQPYHLCYSQPYHCVILAKAGIHHGVPKHRVKWLMTACS